MDIEERIAQFEHMAEADPENEMAHFSLGGAYAQAGRPADSAAAYERCTEVAPHMSKAFQLAAEQHLKAEKRDDALRCAREGYEVAAEQGDLMPKRAIAELLKEMGEEPPEVEGAAPEPEVPAGAFLCRKTGRPGTEMDQPPFKGSLGEWLQRNISRETWNEWIAQGTKVINELRLDLSRDEDSDTYDRYMREFFEIDDDLHERIRSGSASQ